VSPQYQGPIVEVREHGSMRKYAADPAIWKPIRAEKAKQQKQSSAATRSAANASPKREKSVLDQFPDLPRRKPSGTYDFQLQKGETKVWTEQQGWDNAFLGLPSVFLAKVDRSLLTGIALKYSGAVLVTSDAAAVAESRAAFNAELKKHIDEHVVELVAVIAKQSPNFMIAGPGARTLLEDIGSRYGNPLPMLARALNVKVEGLREDQPINGRGQLQIAAVDADILATAYIATLAGVKVNLARDISHGLWRKYARTPLKFPAAKKQVDVGAIRAAVEAGTAQEARA
jgi:hypothetical protein